MLPRSLASHDDMLRLQHMVRAYDSNTSTFSAEELKAVLRALFWSAATPRSTGTSSSSSSSHKRRADDALTAPTRNLRPKSSDQ